MKRMMKMRNKTKKPWTLSVNEAKKTKATYKAPVKSMSTNHQSKSSTDQRDTCPSMTADLVSPTSRKTPYTVEPGKAPSTPTSQMSLTSPASILVSPQART